MRREMSVGSVFGNWTTISPKYKVGNSHHYSVDVRCECGRVATVYSAGLLGKRGSRCPQCGEGGKPKVSGEHIVVSTIYGDYRKTARRRGIKFELARKDFEDLIFKDCAYCGRGPSNVVTERCSDTRTLPKYSGLDRVENDLGYKRDNVVPCCRWCNESKRAKTLDEWESWVKGLIENFNRRNWTQTSKV